MITAGYVFGPQGAANAQIVAYDPLAEGQIQKGITLMADYYPVGPALPRASWPSGSLPYRAKAGSTIMVPSGEADALLQLGAAVAV